MKQGCRSLTDCEDGYLKDASHLIVDRDTSFIAMRDFIDTEVVLLPKPESTTQSPASVNGGRSLYEPNMQDARRIKMDKYS